MFGAGTVLRIRSYDGWDVILAYGTIVDPANAVLRLWERRELRPMIVVIDGFLQFHAFENMMLKVKRTHIMTLHGAFGATVEGWPRYRADRPFCHCRSSSRR